MAQRLAKLVTWTKSSDTATWEAYGFGVINDSNTNTKSGDDSIIITGTLSGEPGFRNAKPLTFGNGENSISIQIGMGDDSTEPGLLNEAALKSAGNLSIEVDNAQATGGGDGLVNLSSISVSGSKSVLQLSVLSVGDTSITNGGQTDLGGPLIATIRGGALSDTITANGVIDNNASSVIDLRGGADSIVAAGIFGHGDITLNTAAKDIITGAGADNIDLSSGIDLPSSGLSSACIDLGTDDDTIRCFGTGRLYGGKGLDTLLLPTGTYQVVSTATKGLFLIDDLNNGGITSLYASGFEQVGSFDGTLSPFKIGSEIGVLTIP